MTIDRLQAHLIGPPPIPENKTVQPVKTGEGKASFADFLKKACDEVGCKVEFSGHAVSRVNQREITLSNDQLARLGKALDSADSKGAKTALVMLDDVAVIVGVPKRTIITVVNGNELQNNVFTQIDTAVIG